MFEFINRIQTLLAKRIWYTTNHVCHQEVNYTITELRRTWGGKYILVAHKPNWQQGKLHWLIYGNTSHAYPKVQSLTGDEAREWASSVHMDTEIFDVVIGKVSGEAARSVP